MRGLRGMWLPALFLATVTGITGCGTAGGGARFPTAPHGWRPARADLDTLDRGEAVLVSRCMVAHGFRYPLAPATPSQPDFRYVIDDVPWAKAHGFGADLAAADDRDRTKSPLARYVRSLTQDRQQAFSTALYGARQNLSERLPQGGTVRQSSQGCQADAENRLYGSMPRWFGADSLADNLIPVAEHAVRADPRFAAATHRWSRCMAAAGMKASDPDALETRMDGTHDRARVRRAAVKEATCARSTGFGALARRLHTMYLAKEQAKYPGAVAAQRGMRYAALPHARRLAASS